MISVSNALIFNKLKKPNTKLILSQDGFILVWIQLWVIVCIDVLPVEVSARRVRKALEMIGSSE